MCGIAGFLGFSNKSADNIKTLAFKMSKALIHRGPDDYGIWFDKNSEVALVHSRLSILDLSKAGHQPMTSKSGRYVISFNGEIYNHLDLRAELNSMRADTIRWNGHSDSETLIECIDFWGLEQAIQKVIGMFAIALWDKKNKALFLLRDRVGEKPLYYGIQKGVLIFGSELKSLKVHPSFNAEINREALSLQLRHSYIPSPFSIYKGVKKLPPGSILKIDVRKGVYQEDQLEDITHFWELSNVINDGLKSPYEGSLFEAENDLENLLTKVIGQQMIADVAFGSLLSGGVDSSLITALMQAQSSNPIKTFSVGFQERGYDEAMFAKNVANFLGTEHTELYLSEKEAMNVIELLPTLYDEPFADISQLSNFFVAKLAKKKVKVVLSGDAGDELFGGYTRYFQAQSFWKKLSFFPLSSRKALIKIINKLNANQLNSIFGPFGNAFIGSNHNLGDKILKGTELLGSKHPHEMYYDLLSYWKEDGSVVMNAFPRSQILQRFDDFSMLEGIEKMMAVDAVTYLPDNILVKIDRASMGVSLENRTPFLDKRLIEFCWRLPSDMKFKKNYGKIILKNILYKYVPKKLVDRPKKGFDIPIDIWLRKSLRDWAENLLSESRLKEEGFFNVGLIRKKWEEHLSGERNWRYHLWNVLMFQAWFDESRKN